jgi:hypothetical protein
MLKLIVNVIFTLIVSPLANANVLEADNAWETNLQQIEAKNPVVEIGKASFSFLVWDIYNSQLATSTGKYPPATQSDTLIYTINYQRDISSKELVERTIEQWNHLKISKDIYSPYINILNDIWPDIKKGDSLALVSNAAGSGFYYNDDLVGSIANTDFSPLFLSIWLSEKTSEPALRQKLLGGEE